MNRRGFLRAIMLAPALPVAAMLPAAASPIIGIDGGGRDEMMAFTVSGCSVDSVQRFFAVHADQLSEILHRYPAT